MADGSIWYVRTDDGNVYGPADMEKLIVWAKDGRIEPTSSISADRENWSPAALCKELDMKWIVEAELGKLFGPFHHDVVSRMINDGLVPATSRIFRLYDGEQEKGAVVVVEPQARPPVRPVGGKGVFAGLDSGRMAALEMAARKEILAAQRRGVVVNMFGSKSK